MNGIELQQTITWTLFLYDFNEIWEFEGNLIFEVGRNYRSISQRKRTKPTAFEPGGGREIWEELFESC